MERKPMVVGTDMTKDNHIGQSMTPVENQFL